MLRMDNLVLAIQSLLVIKGTDCNSRVIQRRLALPNPIKGGWPVCSVTVAGLVRKTHLESDYRIRITSTTNNSITDDSNANFTIRNNRHWLLL